MRSAGVASRDCGGQGETQPDFGTAQGALLPSDIAVQFIGAVAHAAGAAAIANASGIKLPVIGDFKHPVSYTHLDVYKRQADGSAPCARYVAGLTIRHPAESLR